MGPGSRRQRFTVARTRYCCRTPSRPWHHRGHRPARLGLLSWPRGWWVGCSAHASGAGFEPGWASWGRLMRPFPAVSEGRCRGWRTPRRNCLWGCMGCLQFRYGGLETGRGVLAIRPSLCLPFCAAEVVSDLLLDALPTRPPPGPGAAAARPARSAAPAHRPGPACSRPGDPSRHTGGYRSEDAPCASATLLRGFLRLRTSLGWASQARNIVARRPRRQVVFDNFTTSGEPASMGAAGG